MRLVLLPGMDGTGELFADLVAALPAWVEAEAIAYPPDKKLSYAELSELLQAKLTGPPFVLLGESFGSPLAVRIAATAPPNLRGLVICAGFIEPPVGRLAMLLSWIAPLLFRLPVPDFLIRRWMLGSDASSVMVKKVRAAIASSGPGVLASRIQAVLECNATEEWRKVNARVLYLSASEDRLIGNRGLKQLLRTKPEMQSIEIRGPHLVLQANPAAAALAVTQFLRQVAALSSIPPAPTIN